MSEIDYKQYKLGAFKSPPDERDYNISRLISQLPSTTEPDVFEYDYSEYIKDQGNIGQCVSASGSATREIKEKEQTGEYKKFSMGFNYGYRKDTEWQGAGMFPRDYLKGLLDFGIPEHHMFPIEYEVPKIQQEVQKSNIVEILKNAYPNRITGYARVYNPTEIKLALRTLGALMVVVPVYSSFYKTSKYNPVVPVPNENKENFNGSHAMCIVGYDNNKRLFKVANSWGKDWAEKGFCYFDYDWPFWEIWAITDNILPIPPKPIDPIDPLPEPEPEPIPSNIFYRVVTGSFESRENVNKRIADLKSKGFDSFTLIAEVNGKTMFRCITGSFNERNRAEKRIADLKAKGFDSFIAIYKRE